MYRLRKLLISIENTYGKLLLTHFPSRFASAYQSGLKTLDPLKEGGLSVVFVCRGNICRSPYAEKRLEQYWQSDEALKDLPLRASSLGLDTKNEKPANEQACKVALTREVDLSDHLATVADGYALSEADLIFIMERKHLRGIVRLYRYSARKAVMLGSLGLPKYPLVVEDPYGRPEEEFQECFAQIDHALQEFIRVARQAIAQH